ncbi:DUF4139 domain-containing protein [Alloalcanivorax xenomutans]|uniref:DUF4139 domain-containing protein n=1 Tax=Alloalcanivorax xenomutans TaxID=1094342 RepID=UPI0024E1A6CB|nr:DUF4139 domain-containing protein [Alloalcanivorax xenomutans]
MMKRLLLPALIAGLCPPAALAAVFPVTAPVTEVLLFPSQAELTRSLSQPLPAGQHQLTIAGLPELDLDRLRIEVDGAVLEGVQRRRESNAEDVSERRQALDEQIAALERRIQEAATADRLDQEQIQQLQSLLGQAPQGPALYSEVPVEKWSSAWAQIREAVNQRQSAINERAAQRPDWQRQLQALQQQRSQLGQQQQQRQVLVVDLVAEQAGTADLALRYYTHQAGWSNQLQANLNSGAEQIALNAYAEVRNGTGEDWRDVKATLGLLPSGYRSLPEPTPWIVGLARPRPERDRFARAVMAEPVAEMADMASSSLKKGAAAPAPTPQPVAHGFDMRVPLDAPLTLASDGSTARIAYQDAVVPVTLSRESYLWQQPAVLLVGEWKNSSGVPWLSGQVTVLRDGQRLSSYGRAEGIQLGETVRMSFGDDPRLRVEVVTEPASRGEAGLISKENTLTVTRSITVSSGYDKPVDVVLYDRQPVPNDDRIKLEATGAKPDQSNVRDIKGLMAWERTVSADQETRLEHGFQLRYPTDMDLTGVEGLPR